MGLFDETPQYQQPVYTPLNDPARKKQRLMIVVIGIGFLLVVMVGVFSAIRSGSGPSTEYAELAAQHNELLRLVNKHENKARSLDTQNYMARAGAVLTSSSFDWDDFLSSRYSIGISAEQQALVTNTDIDELMEQANIANRFDDDFLREFSVEVEKAETKASRLLETAESDINNEMLNLALTIYRSL